MTRRRVYNRGRIPRSYYILPFQDVNVDYKDPSVPPVTPATGGAAGGGGGKKRTREEMEQYWQSLRNRTRSFREKTGHLISDELHKPKKRLAMEAGALAAFGAGLAWMFAPPGTKTVAAIGAADLAAGIEMTESTALMNEIRWGSYGIRPWYGRSGRYGSVMLRNSSLF